jgi:23S rRNA (pseudouridine1915-N3)-methyltransferase
MKIRVVSVGHRLPVWLQTGLEHYAKRLPREWSFEAVELRSEPRDGSRTVTQMLSAEATRIARAASGRRVIALDEHGVSVTTSAFADKLRNWQDAGDDRAFDIGSADGLARHAKSDATATIALSAMTLPHGLARVLLVEQLYRAHAVMSGHPYHRE